MVLFDSKIDSEIINWTIIDDVVMGGRSHSNFHIHEEGYLIFSGHVSMENNGGFSSIRCRFEKKNIEKYSKATIRLKGDGKTYQFRLKSNVNDSHSYVIHFETSENWEIKTLLLEEMKPQFRGKKLDMGNFTGNEIEEIAFLIANKKAESFQLLIDKIELE